MAENIYKALRRLFAVLLILNTLVIGILIYLTVSGYASQRRSLVEMGETLLRAFEASRPMIFSAGTGNSHLKSLLSEIFDMKTISNFFIYDGSGKTIFELRPVSEDMIFPDLHGTGIVENQNDIVLYNGFHPRMFSMGRNHQTGHGDGKVFVAVSLSKASLNDMRRSGALILTAAFLAELIIFFIYFRTRRLMELYKGSLTELKNAEKEAATGRLSSVLAHEIKNPLSSMDGLLSYALKKNADPSITDLLERTRDEVSRLSDIVNDFLSYGRTVELNLTGTDIGELISRTCELLSHDAAVKKVEFVREGTNFTADADENRFLQVFVNLILNAVDASPAGGRIRIISDEKTRSVRIINDTENDVGSPDKMFEPFYTTKTRGSGLGLSITKRLVEQHGYSIKITDLKPFTVKITFKRSGSQQ